MMMDDYQNNAAFQHGAIIARPDGKGKFRNAGNRTSESLDDKCRRLASIAAHAVQLVAQEARPALRRQHPRTVGQGRGMADVLAVAACQHRDPVAYLILLPADDSPLHPLALQPGGRISSLAVVELAGLVLLFLAAVSSA